MNDPRQSGSSFEDAGADERWRRAWRGRAARLIAIGQVDGERGAPSETGRRWAVETLRREAAFLQRRYLRTGEPLDEGYDDYYLQLGLFVSRIHDSLSVERCGEAGEDRAFAHSLIFLS